VTSSLTVRSPGRPKAPGVLVLAHGTHGVEAELLEMVRGRCPMPVEALVISTVPEATLPH
jgi:hypothetical protein